MENPQLIPSKMEVDEAAQIVWVVKAPFGVKREHIKNPVFWAHVASKLKANHEIKVFAEDGSYYAHFLVLAADRTWANVFELAYHELKKQSVYEEVHDEYEVKFRGPRKWSVIRKADNSVLTQDIPSQDMAEEWLKAHLAA